MSQANCSTFAAGIKKGGLRWPSATLSQARFTCTYDPAGAGAAADIGETERGFQYSFRYSRRMINLTSAWGDTVVDGIYRGISDMFITLKALEWVQGLLTAITPYQTTPLQDDGATSILLGTIGVLDSAKAGILILSDTTGTPAENKPATMTATYSIIREGQDIGWALDSNLREIALGFRILPYDAGAGAITFITAT